MNSVFAQLINLDGSDARLASADQQLKDVGIAYQRMPAFDGRQLDPDDYPDYAGDRARRWYGRALSGGEIGCYVSHLNCAQAFLDSKAEFGLVLEDDIRLEDGFHAALGALTAVLSPPEMDWVEIVNLAASPRRERYFTDLARLPVPDGPARLCYAHEFPVTTTALLWTRSGAEKFLENALPIYAPVDQFLRFDQTRRQTGLCFVPPVVRPEGFGSEINMAPGAAKARQSDRRGPWLKFRTEWRAMTCKRWAMAAKRRLAARETPLRS